MENGSSSSFVKNKKKKKKVPKHNAQSKKKLKVSEGKLKCKCFTCGQKGHWKNDCSKKPRIQNDNTSACLLLLSLKHV